MFITVFFLFDLLLVVCMKRVVVQLVFHPSFWDDINWFDVIESIYMSQGS